jgi:hypothetical protein
MAYEVTFYFHERLEAGGYNTEETKTMTKRYGKGFDEVAVEKLAGAIITQLSRRDVWITNVEVSEFVKKPLRFKETKGGGIILGNKKFTLDGSVSLVEESESLPPPQHTQANQQLIVPQQHVVQNNPPTSLTDHVPTMVPKDQKPLRYVVFNPPVELRDTARIYKLTQNQRYPIFEEKIADVTNMQSGMMYYLRDDLGRGVWARSFYFEDAVTELAYQRELFTDGYLERQMQARNGNPGFIDSARGAYQQQQSFDMPTLRR